MTLTWGIAKTDTHPGIPGIFELPGMQKNLHSKNVDLSKLTPGDGSYSLASTRGEGEGHGIFMPAVQTNTPEAAAIIKEVLQILHKLYHLIMPLCISRFEWDMLEFNALENNVVAFAANVVDLDIELNDEPPPLDYPDEHPDSTVDLDEIILGLLQRSIGGQGTNHGDFQDDPIAFTLFVLMFRLAPGSDLGPFLYMRGGIYLRELDVYILFTSFKAQDIHTGSAPTYVKKIQDAWISMETTKALFERFGPQVRCGYVLYPSMAATSHITQILYSPSLHFLHSPAPSARDSYRKYFSLNGDTVLGNHRTRANRLGLEGLYCLKNYFIQCRLKLGLDVNTLLENTTYLDEDGNSQTLEPSLIDIEDDEAYEMICLYRRFYFWLRDVIAEYSLGLTKPKFKERQKAIHETLSGIDRRQKALPTNGKREWLVRWKDCDASQDMWRDEEQLRGAQELVNKFNSRERLPEALFLRSPSPCSSELTSCPPTPSPESSDTEFQKPKAMNLSSRSKRYLRVFDMDTPIIRKLETQELNTNFLGDLLNSASLKTECDDLDLAKAVLTKPTDFRLANESPRMVAGRIVDQIERNNELSTQMYFELPSITSSTWGSRLANLTLACIADVGLSVPDLVAQDHLHDLISRGVQAQVCRSLVAIYQWILYLGPSLTEQLTSMHKDKGEEELTQKFPELAPVVNHVVAFVRKHQKQQELEAEAKAKVKAEQQGQAQPTRGRRKRRKIGRAASDPHQNRDSIPTASMSQLRNRLTCLQHKTGPVIQQSLMSLLAAILSPQPRAINLRLVSYTR
ncbi:hypothetical protein B0H10DRAFT_2225397 [Mycena sp. CBHHK59/15]|nr:hypothetical protein B0H10DRAFT_2225397 [Mycena sp. CBHHK59/15]